MPWNEKGVEMLREEFIQRCMRPDRNVSALCDEYGISRKTGYKWLKRYQEDHELQDKSKSPINKRTKTEEKTESLILEVREEHPAWGAQKIRLFLCKKGYQIPCKRTINNILKRNGMITKEASLARRPFIRFVRANNNELWQADFKGDFAMANGLRCYPLSILDDHSRFALLIEPKSDVRNVMASFIRVFREFGLPDTILTDNGPVFAGFKNGYTQLERMFMDQGVLPIHGRPYHPQTQGKIERFHRSMKAEILHMQDILDLEDAMRVFSSWQNLYNFERPHEALGDKCPGDVYSPSPKPFVEVIPPFDYDPQFRLYRINNWGYLRFAHHQIYISETFRDTDVQLIPLDEEDVAVINYRNFIIAKIDLNDGHMLSRTAYRWPRSV